MGIVVTTWCLGSKRLQKYSRRNLSRQQYVISRILGELRRKMSTRAQQGECNIHWRKSTLVVAMTTGAIWAMRGVPRKSLDDKVTAFRLPGRSGLVLLLLLLDEEYPFALAKGRVLVFVRLGHELRVSRPAFLRKVTCDSIRVFSSSIHTC